MTERAYDVGEVVLNVAEGGAAGEPLLLLPGATLTWQSFGELIPELEKQWHLYAVDYRGHGKSGRPPSGSYRIIDHLRDVSALAGQLRERPIVAIGLSLGADLALGLAAEVPRLIRAIIALEPGLSRRECGVGRSRSSHEGRSRSLPFSAVRLTIRPGNS